MQDLPNATSAPPLTIPITNQHRRRLRAVWRSAGWPCQDMVEVELLAAGLLARGVDVNGREAVRVTDAGIQLLAATLQKNRAVRDAHEALVEQVAVHMQRAGRIVWRGLTLRAGLHLAQSPNAPNVPEDPNSPITWAMAMPDVFSIRNTTVEQYVEPVVHEIKVRRSDLLGDVRNPAKRAAYLALSSECWYVLKAGIGGVDDVPESCGVLVADGAQLDVLRPAPKRAMQLGFATWMVLAKAQPLAPLDSDAQAML